MNRHPFRWESLAFGLFFLACAGSWAVGKQDLLTARELSLTAAGVLIVVGLMGVAATLWQARPARNSITTPPTTIPEDSHEEAHPHP